MWSWPSFLKHLKSTLHGAFFGNHKEPTALGHPSPARPPPPPPFPPGGRGLARLGGPGGCRSVSLSHGEAATLLALAFLGLLSGRSLCPLARLGVVSLDVGSQGKGLVEKCGRRKQKPKIPRSTAPDLACLEESPFGGHPFLGSMLDLQVSSASSPCLATFGGDSNGLTLSLFFSCALVC